MYFYFMECLRSTVTQARLGFRFLPPFCSTRLTFPQAIMSLARFHHPPD